MLREVLDLYLIPVVENNVGRIQLNHMRPSHPLPHNIKFDHGPLFSDCVASLKLSDYVYDLAEAKEDLKDARDKAEKSRRFQ